MWEIYLTFNTCSVIKKLLLVTASELLDLCKGRIWEINELNVQFDSSPSLLS